MCAEVRTDAELIAACQRGCRDAAAAILERHDGIVRGVVKIARHPPSVDREDLLQVGRMALLVAAKSATFDADKSKWTTFATTVVRRAVWKEVFRLSRQQVGGIEDWSQVENSRELSRDNYPATDGYLGSITSDLAYCDTETNDAARDNGLPTESMSRILAFSLSVAEDLPCR